MKMYVGSCAHSGYLALLWFLEGWGSSAEEWKKSQNICCSRPSLFYFVYMSNCVQQTIRVSVSIWIYRHQFSSLFSEYEKQKTTENRRRATSTAFPADKQRFHFHGVFSLLLPCRVEWSWAMHCVFIIHDVAPTFIVFQIVCARWDVWLSFDVMWYVMFFLAQTDTERRGESLRQENVVFMFNFHISLLSPDNSSKCDSWIFHAMWVLSNLTFRSCSVV